jgi:hypothetical protein
LGLRTLIALTVPLVAAVVVPACSSTAGAGRVHPNRINERIRGTVVIDSIEWDLNDLPVGCWRLAAGQGRGRQGLRRHGPQDAPVSTLSSTPTPPCSASTTRVFVRPEL